MVAERIFEQGYRLARGSVWSLRGLVEMACTEAEIEHIIGGDGGKSSIRLDSLDSAMRKVQEDYLLRRIETPLVESRHAPGSYVSQFGDPSDSDASVPALEGMRFFHLTLQMRDVLFALDPRQFELLCAHVARAVGCENITTTQQSKDDGVDVLAELPMRIALKRGTALYRLAGGLSFLVYVQAKRYASDHPVQQSEVFEVLGSWQALRNEFADGTIVPEQADALRKADYRAADPVLLVMMTTSRFTRGSKKKATAIGAILLDGEQIAQLLLERRFAVARTEHPDGQFAVTKGSLIHALKDVGGGYSFGSEMEDTSPLVLPRLDVP